MKLIHDHLSKFWQAGIIMGFVERDQAEKILINCSIGTFLLRFTETIIGKYSFYLDHFFSEKISKNEFSSQFITNV